MNFVRIGEHYINLNNVAFVRRSPVAGALEVVFFEGNSDHYGSLVFDGNEAKKLVLYLENASQSDRAALQAVVTKRNV